MDLRNRAVERDAQRPLRLALLARRLQFNCCSSAKTRSSTPWSIQRRPRLETVCQGLKRSGKARQLQPSLVTNSQPSSTCRAGSLQLPRGVGISGAIRAHCASVSRMISLTRPPDRPPTLTQVSTRVNRP